MVTVMSALRLATTTQGVTQVVGLSSPDSSAVAPEGVDIIEIFSVVPRDTDAQPMHGSTSAAATNTLIIFLRFPMPSWKVSRNHNVNARGRSRQHGGSLIG